MSGLLRFYRTAALLWPSLDILVLDVDSRDESDVPSQCFGAYLLVSTRPRAGWHFGILLLNFAYVKDNVLSFTWRTTHYPTVNAVTLSDHTCANLGTN